MCDFLNDVRDHGNTFTPTEITMPHAGLCMFQQDMITSSMHDDLHTLIAALPMLNLPTTLMMTH